MSGNSGQSVVFFPTAAYPAAGGGWCVPVHGWVYREAELSRLRRFAFGVVKGLVERRWPGVDFDGETFRERVGAFLADNARGRKVAVEYNGVRFCLKKSKPNGHFWGEFLVQEGGVSSLFEGASGPGTAAGWRTYREARPAGEAAAEGRVLFVPAEGVSVISDIDDTIKETGVLTRDRMLASTFLEEFREVGGMAGVYRKWAAERGAVFHYVSASPWHLYGFLSAFLEGQGFPAGTFHLRDFRLVPGSLIRTMRPSGRVKYLYCRELMRRWPGRKFILVGDSGEGDAKMYCRLAKEFGGQVERIWIRDVGREVRCEGAEGLVRVFRESGELGL